MAKLLTLEEWASEVYGDHPPALKTLRKWARDCRIYPPAEKHGRTFFVPADARYHDPSKPVVVPPHRSSLVDRIGNGNGKKTKH